MKNKIKIIALFSFFILIIVMIICLKDNITQKINKEFAADILVTAIDRDAEDSLAFLDKMKDTFLISNPSEFDGFINILNLKKDQELCIGEEYEIEWESKNVDQVLIKILKGNSTYYITDKYIPSKDGINKYIWKAGKIGNENLKGNNFKLNITNRDIWDIQNTVLNFKKCDKSIDIQ